MADTDPRHKEMVPEMRVMFIWKMSKRINKFIKKDQREIKLRNLKNIKKRKRRVVIMVAKAKVTIDNTKRSHLMFLQMNLGSLVIPQNGLMVSHTIIYIFIYLG